MGECTVKHLCNSCGTAFAHHGMVTLKECNGSFNLCCPLLPKLRHTLQNLQMLRKCRMHRVVSTDHLKVSAKCPFPILCIIFLVNTVDQRHRGLPRPTQYLHFRFILFTIGLGTVNHINDTCPFHNGFEQFYLIMKTGIAFMDIDKFPHDFMPSAGIGFMLSQPGKYLSGTLETGCVNEFIQCFPINLQWITRLAGGCPRRIGNGNGIIHRQ